MRALDLIHNFFCGLTVTALQTPGHAPEHNCYLVALAGRPASVLISGDLIFADPSVAMVNFRGTTANAGANNLLNATGGSFTITNSRNGYSKTYKALRR